MPAMALLLLLQGEEDADHVGRLREGVVVAAVATGMKQCDLGLRGQHVGRRVRSHVAGFSFRTSDCEIKGRPSQPRPCRPRLLISIFCG